MSRAETDLVYANIPTEKKLVVYEQCGHESLCEKENAKWMTEVKSFLSH